MRTLRGQNTLITGASRGLGRALAEALSARGARVGLVARMRADVELVARTLRAEGRVAEAFEGDLGVPRAQAALAAAVAERLGPVDLLVHNASDLGPVPLELVLDTPQAALERAFAVNVFGPFALSRAIVGSMVLRGAGTVLHVSSDAAVSAYPEWGAYGASKAAFDHLTRTLSAELATSGVRFLGVDPGEMDTKMHADALPAAERSALARPRDVAEKIVRLLEEDAYASGARVVL